MYTIHDFLWFRNMFSCSYMMTSARSCSILHWFPKRDFTWCLQGASKEVLQVGSSHDVYTWCSRADCCNVLPPCLSYLYHGVWTVWVVGSWGIRQAGHGFACAWASLSHWVDQIGFALSPDCKYCHVCDHLFHLHANLLIRDNGLEVVDMLKKPHADNTWHLYEDTLQ